MTVTNERISLDPAEITASRQEVDITPWIDMEGIDWGEAAIEPVMAEMHRGEIPVDFRVPNRNITVPLNFVARGGTTALEARSVIQAKAKLFQWEGGWIKRLTNSGGTVFADVVNASFAASSISGWESASEMDLEAQLTLEVLPDFYEAERDLGDNTETTAAELIFTETGIEGDYPARMRMVVDDDQAVDQRGLLWGFRSRHYSSASTAALKYEAEALTAMDTATKLALSGASGGTVVRHGTLSTSWTPVMNTNLAAGTYLTHTGTYRLWGRVYSTSGTTVQSRAVWDVGDLVNPAENDATRMLGASNFFMQDYGEVRLDPSPVGTHRWQGQIQAKGDVGSENFSVDKLWLVPVDEGYGKLTAPFMAAEGMVVYSARSEFKTESGALTGDSLATGGVWTAATGSDADDFNEINDTATRTAVSDAAPRIVYPGSMSNLTTTVAKVDFKVSTFASAPGVGLVVRYTGTDVANFVRVYASWQWTGAVKVDVEQIVASVATGIVESEPIVGQADQWYTLFVYVLGGQIYARISPQGSTLALCEAFGASTALISGGALDDGKVGLWDQQGSGTACTRSYDNFAVWVPAADGVIMASQSVQLTSDGHFREDAAGASYGPVSIRAGDLPRLPVAGLEGRTTEVSLKGSRGDLNLIPDVHTSAEYGDNISARIFYRPCWLHVPSS